MKKIPQYKSHKIVGGLQINTIEHLNDDFHPGDDIGLTFVKEGFEPITVTVPSLIIPEPGWYLVFYEDGYKSFSPPEAFESGYSPVEVEINETIKIVDGWEISDSVSGLKITVSKGIKENRLHIEHISMPIVKSRDFWFDADGNSTGLGADLTDNAYDIPQRENNDAKEQKDGPAGQESNQGQENEPQAAGEDQGQTVNAEE